MVSTYWSNKILEAAYTNSDTEFWMGLSSSCPSQSGENVSEPVGAGYTRVRISGFSQPSNGMVHNLNNLTFPESADVWFSGNTKAKYWVLFDGNGTSANVLSAGELYQPITIEANTTVSVNSGEVCVTLTDCSVG